MIMEVIKFKKIKIHLHIQQIMIINHLNINQTKNNH
jgi:hypothetical protein